MPALYGLIGYPLGHSFSPAYFAKKFATQHIDASYEAFPLQNIAEFNSLLAKHDLKGLNVTIPYKEAIISYLDALDDTAQKVAAVNTILFKDGRKVGYNTDVIGFEQSLVPLLKAHHKQALILGTGGASKAVAYVLEEKGIPYTKVSRIKREDVLTYDELTPELLAENTLIVNCSPVGKIPELNKAPAIPYKDITTKHLLYDLIYNPSETMFLMVGKQRGAQTKNGLEMLQLQAEASWHIWNNS